MNEDDYWEHPDTEAISSTRAKEVWREMKRDFWRRVLFIFYYLFIY